MVNMATDFTVRFFRDLMHEYCFRHVSFLKHTRIFGKCSTNWYMENPRTLLVRNSDIRPEKFSSVLGSTEWKKGVLENINLRDKL